MLSNCHIKERQRGFFRDQTRVPELTPSTKPLLAKRVFVVSLQYIP